MSRTLIYAYCTRPKLREWRNEPDDYHTGYLPSPGGKIRGYALHSYWTYNRTVSTDAGPPGRVACALDVLKVAGLVAGLSPCFGS